jgi:hypothetical protein
MNQTHVIVLKTCQGYQKFVRLADGSLVPYHENHAPLPQPGVIVDAGAPTFKR